MHRFGGAYCFRRVRSQRKSVDWGTMGPALGGAYECYAHIFSLIEIEKSVFYSKLPDVSNTAMGKIYARRIVTDQTTENHSQLLTSVSIALSNFQTEWRR